MIKLHDIYEKHFEGNKLRKPIIIENPGTYFLSDNIEIEFDPPYPSQKEIIDLPSLRYGYFGGILLIGNNIHIDLNGHEIKMTEKFALQQRFFSIFEMTNSPFPLHDGLPLSMTKEQWKTGENITIRNGNIGRSSHTGIHGNNNNNVNIYSLNIYDFEVGGIMTNGATDVNLHCCSIGPNFQNLWVNAKLSSAQQLVHFYENVIPQQEPMDHNLEELKKKVEDAVNATSVKEIPIIFRNDNFVCDGTVYGLSLHRKGVAIGGHTFPTADTISDMSSNHYCIKNISIQNLKGNVDEKTSYVTKDGKILRDVAGQIIDIDYVLQNKTLDILTKVQINSYKWLENYPDFKTTFFVPENILDFYNSQHSSLDNFQTIVDESLTPKMGRDIMIHVNKGVIAVRLDSLSNVRMQNVNIQQIENIANHQVLNTEYLVSAMMEDSLNEYKGNDTLALTCSNVKEGHFENITIEKIISKHGTAYAILMMNHCENIQSHYNRINIGKENKQNCGILIQDSCKGIKVSCA